MATAIHSMIRVLEEDRSVEFYDKAFGFSVSDRIELENFTLVYLRNSESHFELELTINKGVTEPYDLGNGYGHLAFSVEDLDSEHQRFTDAGWAPRKIVELSVSGKTLARFFFVADPDGYLIEVLQRGGRYD